MKKYTLLLTVVLFILTSCQERFEEENLQDHTVWPEFEAATDSFPSQTTSGTRTSLLPDRQIVWNASDRISIFPGSTVPVSYEVKAGTHGGRTCTFVPVSPDGTTGIGTSLSRNVAVYASDAVVPGSLAETEQGHFVFQTELPAESRYGLPDRHFYEDFTMVAAAAGNHLDFKNCYGLVELQLKGEAVIRKIALTAGSGEFLSGKHTVVFGEKQMPVCAPEGEYQKDWFSETAVLLDDVPLRTDHLTPFYLVIPPTEFKNGFDLVLTAPDGKVFSCHASAGNVVCRNDILVMPPLEVKMVEKWPVVNITHGLYFYTIPVFSGELSEGSIKWGDQIEEAYRTAAQHTYNTGGEHEVEIAVRGAEGIHFENLTGISCINLSQF